MSWLAGRIVQLRAAVFNRVNGDQAVTFPNELVGPDRFAEIYQHPAANGRSKGAGLSDLFWYWLAPGPHIHQEHLEPGPRYDEVAACTLSFLAGSSQQLSTPAQQATSRVLAELRPGVNQIRLRDLMMPIWAEYCYQLVFGEQCPREARDLIVANADDVVSALKCTRLRHPARRTRLTRYLLTKLDQTVQPLPTRLSRHEQAWYLQGTFFNTAVVQLSEGMAHLLLALAEHPDVQDRVVHDADDRYFAHVLDETFRRYPLFGIAHRITTADIVIDDQHTLPTGSVLCFDYAAYHSTGYDRPEEFDPDRWNTLSAKQAHHIPFGMAGNRPCPAWHLAPLAMRAAAREVLRQYRLASSVSHTRSIPHRAPCLLIPRGNAIDPAFRLRTMKIRDEAEDIGRSISQLVLGTIMVLHARKLRLTQRYFDEHEPTTGCPFPHSANQESS